MTDETSRSKRIAKNTLMLYVRMLFLMFVNLYASRVILQALGVEDYGIYNIVGGFVMMFSIISSPLSSACSRFLNYEMGRGSKESVCTVFSTSVTVHALLALIIVVLSEVIGAWYISNYMVLPDSRLWAAKVCFQFSVLNFCMAILTVPYNAAIVAHERMSVYAYVSIFEGVAKLLVCFLIMVSPIDRLVFYGLLLLIIQLLVQMAYRLYCRRHFEECHYHWVFNRSLVRQIFSYTGWQVIGNSARVLKTQGVNLVLNLFFGPAVNAAKGIANQVQGTIEGFASNFMMATNPQITQSYAEGNLSYMFKLLYNGSRICYYLLFILSMPVIVNADFLLGIWLKEVPEFTVWFVQLSLLSAMVTSIAYPLITAQNATGRIREYQIVIGGVQLFNLPLSYLFLWLGYDPVSVMWVAVAMELLSLFLRLYMIPHYIPEFHVWDFIRKVVAPCFSVTVASAIIPVMLKVIVGDSVITSLFNIVLTFAISVLLVLFLGCTASERTLVYSNVARRIRLQK